MNSCGRIITIGLTTAWDMHCKIDGIEWSEHKTISSYTKEPAGKSLNINKALAYLGQSSIAAGLWSQSDYNLMAEKLSPLAGFVDIQLTAAPGITRTNITVEDTAAARHLHLRFPDEMCSEANLKKVADQLGQIVKENDICVLAGSMPAEKFLPDVFGLINCCVDKGARIVLDTSGSNFRKVLDACKISVISPNIDELGELLGCKVKDEPVEIVKAVKPLFDKVDAVLVSRGKLGAMIITAQSAFSCSLVNFTHKATNEVGCGDHFLAGFIAGVKEYQQFGKEALEKGVKLATAHACGFTKTNEPAALEQLIEVQTQQL